MSPVLVTRPLPRLGALIATRPPLTRVCYVVSAGLIASGLLHLAIAALDDRPWDGPLSWRKAATFGVSFGVTLATVTWAASPLTLPDRTRRLLLGVFAADCVVEVAGVTIQAWRHVPSHLNRSTPANTAIAMTLAAGGAVLVVVLGRLAVTAFTRPIAAAPSMTLALRAGFALLLAGLLSGAAMIARGTVAMQTGPAARAYEVTGFLKDFHGVTLHGILVLPALAWWLGRQTMAEARRVRVVRLAVGGYLLAAAAVLVASLLRAFG